MDFSLILHAILLGLKCRLQIFCILAGVDDVPTRSDEVYEVDRPKSYPPPSIPESRNIKIVPTYVDYSARIHFHNIYAG